jgi:hypothetical protein
MSNENQENSRRAPLRTVLNLILNDIAFNAGGGDAPEVIRGGRRLRQPAAGRPV